MKQQETGKIIRLIHRASGLLLFPLVLLKLLSGYHLVSRLAFIPYSTASGIHLSLLLDIPLLGLFTFHGAFGVLRILLPGLNHKFRAACITACAALAVFAAAVAVLYFF